MEFQNELRHLWNGLRAPAQGRPSALSVVYDQNLLKKGIGLSCKRFHERVSSMGDGYVREGKVGRVLRRVTMRWTS